MRDLYKRNNCSLYDELKRADQILASELSLQSQKKKKLTREQKSAHQVADNFDYNFLLVIR
jgi:hypothetical protein